MSPWELMNRFRQLSAKLAQDGLKEHEQELSDLIGVLGTILEAHNHDLNNIKSTVARLERIIRHRAAAG